MFLQFLWKMEAG